jgi:hypothetical protein
MAVLAAAASSSLKDSARQMVHIARMVEPAKPFAAYAEQYIAVVTELARRGWLAQPLAAAAVEGAGL